MKQPKPEIITASSARAYWRALMGNAVSLIEDAALLMESSPSRARSLLILAQEEIGKASSVYELAAQVWTKGGDKVELPPRFIGMERRHHPKIVASLDADERLDSFWGDYSKLDLAENDLDLANLDQYVEELLVKRDAKAGAVNLQKQAGFYVDREGEEIRTPQSVDVEDLVGLVIRTARVAEMLLITDHSRMKTEARSTYDSTGDLQARLMPYSHPGDFFELLDRQDHPAGGDE